MSEPVEIEVFVAMNENGSFAVADNADDAHDLLRDDIGGDASRLVKLIVTMSPPEVITVAVVVPDDAGQVTAVAATGAAS